VVQLLYQLSDPGSESSPKRLKFQYLPQQMTPTVDYKHQSDKTFCMLTQNRFYVKNENMDKDVSVDAKKGNGDWRHTATHY